MSKQALLSVYDKTGLVELGQALVAHGYQLIASGGTAAALEAAGLEVAEVADVTGYPHLLGGRVKTLHPTIHGGILARDNDSDHAELGVHGIKPIDVVVCNLYPFFETVTREGVSDDEIIEQIDIGGVTLLRAAAKNWSRVTVVGAPQDYPAFIETLATGGPDAALRRTYARRAFQQTAAYDAAISRWFDDDALPEQLSITAARTEILR